MQPDCQAQWTVSVPCQWDQAFDPAHEPVQQTSALRVTGSDSETTVAFVMKSSEYENHS